MHPNDEFSIGFCAFGVWWCCCFLPHCQFETWSGPWYKQKEHEHCRKAMKCLWLLWSYDCRGVHIFIYSILLFAHFWIQNNWSFCALGMPSKELVILCTRYAFEALRLWSLLCLCGLRLWSLLCLCELKTLDFTPLHHGIPRSCCILPHALRNHDGHETFCGLEKFRFNTQNKTTFMGSRKTKIVFVFWASDQLTPWGFEVFKAFADWRI